MAQRAKLQTSITVWQRSRLQYSSWQTWSVLTARQDESPGPCHRRGSLPCEVQRENWMSRLNIPESVLKGTRPVNFQLPTSSSCECAPSVMWVRRDIRRSEMSCSCLLHDGLKHRIRWVFIEFYADFRPKIVRKIIKLTASRYRHQQGLRLLFDRKLGNLYSIWH